MCFKQQICVQLQRSKETIETELKNLIGEIGEDGKNVRELEKQRKRLECKVLEYEKVMKDEAAIRVELENSVFKLDKEKGEQQVYYEAEFSRTSQVNDDTRRVLMKEVFGRATRACVQYQEWSYQNKKEDWNVAGNWFVE